MTNLAVTAQWYATIFYFKSVTCQQMGLANLVALSATTYIYWDEPALLDIGTNQSGHRD